MPPSILICPLRGGPLSQWPKMNCFRMGGAWRGSWGVTVWEAPTWVVDSILRNGISGVCWIYSAGGSRSRQQDTNGNPHSSRPHPARGQQERHHKPQDLTGPGSVACILAEIICSLPNAQEAWDPLCIRWPQYSERSRGHGGKATPLKLCWLCAQSRDTQDTEVAGAVSSSLSISHHLSHELEPAREGPALPSLLFSVMSGVGRRWCRMDTGISEPSRWESKGVVCTFSSPLPGTTLASVCWLPGWHAKILGWESSIAGSTKRTECRDGGLVPTWHASWVPGHLERCSATCPSVSLSPPPSSGSGGVLKRLLHLSRQGVGRPQTLLCLRAVITSAFKFYQVGTEPEMRVLFPGHGRRGTKQVWEAVTLLVSTAPLSVSVCLSEVRAGERQAEGVSRLGRVVGRVSLEFHKLSFERDSENSRIKPLNLWQALCSLKEGWFCSYKNKQLLQARALLCYC